MSDNRFCTDLTGDSRLDCLCGKMNSIQIGAISIHQTLSEMDQIALIVSAILVSVQALTFFFVKEIWNVHPMPIIAALQGATGLGLWCIGTASLDCSLQTYSLFSITTFGGGTADADADSEALLYKVRLFLQQFTYYFYVAINFLLCMDLYLGMRDPFKKSGSRVQTYVITSFVVTLTLAVVLPFWTNIMLWFYVVFGLVYAILAVLTTLYIIVRLYKSGLSAQVRSLILRRHLFWITVFCLSNGFIAYLVAEELMTSYNRARITEVTSTVKILQFIWEWQGLFVFVHMAIEYELYQMTYRAIFKPKEVKKELTPVLMCTC